MHVTAAFAATPMLNPGREGGEAAESPVFPADPAENPATDTVALGGVPNTNGGAAAEGPAAVALPKPPNPGNR